MARTFDATPFENLRKPTDEEYKSIERALKLTTAQSEALQRCVNSIVADCKRYYADTFPRPDNEAMRNKAASDAAKNPTPSDGRAAPAGG